LAWLGQESHADFAFPVRDVVAQGRHPWNDDDLGVQEAMDALDIAHLAGRPVTELSGGERRRVFLARALATGSPIQVWDEPTASLDPRHALEVLDLARRLSASGSTVLVSLHELRQAMRFDRVAVMEQGALIALGKPMEILKPELIRAVFRVEARIAEGLLLELPSSLD
jgi:iron complex transport system ATP-binding protein